MATYKTPDVYVEEIPLFPPSVAEVETAIPAFIGHTRRAVVNGQDSTNKPIRITSLMEYHQRFGMYAPYLIEEIKLDGNNNVQQIGRKCSYYLYDSIRLFFQNGGSTCYIVSVGNFDPDDDKGKIEMGKMMTGLEKLKKVDEVTLLVMPDAVNLGDKGLYAVQQAALKQCNELQDRFVIMDLYESSKEKEDFYWQDGVNEFRDRVGINYLKYGAAYTPHLVANIERQVGYDHVAGKLKDNDDNDIELYSLPHDPKVTKILNDLKQATDDADRIANGGDLSTIGNFLTKRFPGKGINSIEAGYFCVKEESEKNQVADLKKKIAKLDADIGKLDASKPQEKKTVDTLRKEKAGLQKQIDDQAGAQGHDDDVVKYLLEILVMVVAPWGEKDKSVLSPIIYQYVRDKMTAFRAEINQAKVDEFFTNWSSAKAATALKDIKEKYGIKEKSSFEDFVQNIFAGCKGVKLDAEKAADILAQQSTIIGDLIKRLSQYVENIQKAARNNKKNLEAILLENFPLYRDIVDKLKESLRTLPPSGAVAGIYAAVDNDRGVWKAPANVSLSSVLGLTCRIDNREQENLNVDVTAGKSINAIRPFTGKGMLVWGGRTLAGNDNEWRYVSVRRFFNMVEESVKKSTYWAVFEPNDSNLWVKVKAMIENYLIEKWKEGALAGAKPGDAFFVNCGLGSTMSAQDILEGRMIVEIGMAVVRPAEFIILRFMHKMQES